jgi:Fe-Mn family superoxide dismutase
MFKLPDLPYAKSALAPFLSEETLTYHHDKHFNAYVEKLNSLITGTGYENLSLAEIIRKSAEENNKAVFNNAGQVFNHDFYFKCLGQEPDDNCPMKYEVLKKLISNTFSDKEDFTAKVTDAAVNNFGSGWTWLVQNGDHIEIINYSNADNPLRDHPDMNPLLCIDVWEHAYYIDYRNDRKKYVTALLGSINWKFVASQAK